MIDHCMSALQQMQKDLAFKSYVADGLYAMINHTGQAYSTRFIELVLPNNEDEESSDEDNMAKAKEIQDRLKAKLGGDVS